MALEPENDEKRIRKHSRQLFQENTEDRQYERKLENLGTPTGVVFHSTKRLVRARPEVRLKPHIGVLLSSAYNIINTEFQRLQEKQQSSILDEEEARRFNKLADSLTKLAREEREQEMRDDPGTYSDEELMALVEEAKVRLLEGK